MHAVVITFDLLDMSAEEYTAVAAELAPSFEALPGLLTKVWLQDEEGPHRGGFYLFADAASADGFLGSALARGVAENPHFAGLQSHRFAVDAATTARTQPRLTVVPAPVRA